MNYCVRHNCGSATGELQKRERVRGVPFTLLQFLLMVFLPGEVVAQDEMVVRDNSFLIEEAYNQEAGVVQHISTFQHTRGDVWAASFTQEWPLGGIRHQLSWSLSAVNDGLGGGIGDGAINYRYQLLGADGGTVSLAPRISALVPVGSWDRGRGTGAGAVQLNLPVSVDLSRMFVFHFNAGSTLTPSARGPGDVRALALDVHSGASLVYLLRPWVNLMAEVVSLDEATVVAEGETDRATTTLVNPGVRFALNAGATQLVPGVAWTIDLAGPNGLFLYMSVEHGF